MLEEQIETAALMGLLVNNLFQLDDGRWQANVRLPKANASGDFCHQFGTAATPGEALAKAISEAAK